MVKVTRPDLKNLEIGLALTSSMIHEMAHQAMGMLPCRTSAVRYEVGKDVVLAMVVESACMLSAMIDTSSTLKTDPYELAYRLIDTMIAWQEEQDPSTRN